MSKINLLLGINDRVALENARSVGKQGVEIATVYFEKSTLADRSKFVRRSLFRQSFLDASNGSNKAKG